MCSITPSVSVPTPVWIDCDPGHDDAFALLLAATSPEINILGISIVHGNDRVEHCALNAIRFLWTCGVTNIPVYRGVEAPIMRDPKFCPEIHGVPGEDGVSGMCGFHFPDDRIFKSWSVESKHGVLAMREALVSHPEKVTVIATGAQTNVALCLRMFPEVKDKIAKIVFMGGAVGLGNTGIAAEFNIEIDPEAAHIVLHSGVPIVMVPLEVTHENLVTDDILEHIGNLHLWDENSPELPFQTKSEESSETKRPHHHFEYSEIFNRMKDIKNANSSNSALKPEAKINTASHLNYESTSFAKCCVQLLTFFKSTYSSVFSFSSPPLHDPCAVFYVIQPEAFETMEMFVDVETSSLKCAGRTLCDLHGLLNKATNVTVCTKMNKAMFWKRMFQCLQQASKNCPL